MSDYVNLFWIADHANPWIRKQTRHFLQARAMIGNRQNLFNNFFGVIPEYLVLNSGFLQSDSVNKSGAYNFRFGHSDELIFD